MITIDPDIQDKCEALQAEGKFSATVGRLLKEHFARLDAIYNPQTSETETLKTPSDIDKLMTTYKTKKPTMTNYEATLIKTALDNALKDKNEVKITWKGNELMIL